MSGGDHCAARKANGELCRAKPMKGKTVCRAHTGEPRRNSLTAEITARVTEALLVGSDRRHACQHAGIGHTAFYAWLERGEADLENDVRSLYADFADACARAEAEAKMLHVVNLRRHAYGFKDAEGRFHSPDAKVSMWWLERRGGEEWQPKDRHEHRHSGGVRTDAPVVPEDEGRLLAVGGILAAIGAIGDEVEVEVDREDSV